MTLFGIVIGILTGVLTYVTWRNGRWMKQSHQDTLSFIRQSHQDTLSLIRQSHQDTLAILERIESGQNETRKEVAEVRKEMAEAIKYLGQLIVSESEKTRQLIGGQP